MKKTTLLYSLLIVNMFFLFFEVHAQNSDLPSKKERLLLEQYMYYLTKIDDSVGTLKKFKGLFNTKAKHCDDIDFSRNKLTIKDYFNKVHEKKDYYIMGYQVLGKSTQKGASSTVILKKFIRVKNTTKNFKLKITIKEGGDKMLKIAKVAFYDNENKKMATQNEKAQKQKQKFNDTHKTTLNTYSTNQTNNKSVASKKNIDLYWDVDVHPENKKTGVIEDFCIKSKKLKKTSDGKYYIIGFPEKYIKNYTVKSGDCINEIQNNHNNPDKPDKPDNEKTYNYIGENNRIVEDHIEPGQILLLFDDVQYRKDHCDKKYNIQFKIIDKQNNKVLSPYQKEKSYFLNEYYHLDDKMTEAKLKNKANNFRGFKYNINGNNATVTKEVNTKTLNFKVVDAESGNPITDCKLNWYVNGSPTTIKSNNKGDGSYYCTLIDSEKIFKYKLTITKNNYINKIIETPLRNEIENPVKLSPKKFSYIISFKGNEYSHNNVGCNLPAKITGSLRSGTSASLQSVLTNKFKSDYWKYKDLPVESITENNPKINVDVIRKYQQQNLTLQFSETNNVSHLSFTISDFKEKSPNKSYEIPKNKQIILEINYPDTPFKNDYFEINFTQPVGNYLIINGEPLPADQKEVHKRFYNPSEFKIKIDIKPIPPFDIFYIDFYSLDGEEKRIASNSILKKIYSQIDDNHKVYLFFSNNNKPETKRLSKMNKDSIKMVINNIYSIEVLSHPNVGKESKLLKEKILTDIEKRKNNRKVQVNCYYYLSTETINTIQNFETNFQSFLRNNNINPKPIKINK